MREMKEKNPRPKSSKLLTFFNPILSFFKPNHRETRFIDLPRVIMVEILSKLPIASILSSRRVCKLWYNLFSDPLFLTMYRSRLPPPCILFSRDHGISQLLELDLCCDDYSSRLHNRPILMSRPGLNTPVKRGKDILVEDYPMLRLIGSCNGFIGLITNIYDINTSVYISNSLLELNSWKKDESYLKLNIEKVTCLTTQNPPNVPQPPQFHQQTLHYQRPHPILLQEHVPITNQVPDNNVHPTEIQIEKNNSNMEPLLLANHDASILPSITPSFVQVHEQIISKKDARRMPYENELESLTEFLPKNSKLERCNDKLIKEWILG
ncbi:hypothetical protein FXO38_14293 [Capsicum annuum]|nr:hypothetical protein FXO38_14293 [Capsicum annuum]